MVWIRWAFISLNALYCILSLYWESRSNSNTFGKLAGAAVWIWQLVGVVIVVWLGVSAWHLLWWFVLGYALAMGVVRIMSGMGYHTSG